MKKLFVCLGVAVALLVGCDGGSNGALNGPQGGFSYATVDDLPNCSGTREGEVALVESDSTANLCTGGIWHNIGASVATEDALQNCSPNREGSKVYVMESARSLFCTDGRWVEYESGSSSNNAVASSSSYAIASSSSFYYVLPYFNIASSSSAMESSSSNADAVCYGEYSGEYTCITTKYLNQKMLDANGYGEFVDTRDNQVYRTIKIGDQTWMAQNLNYNYNEGTAKNCYNGVQDNCAKYGRLYTWEVAMDKAGCGYGKYCSNSNEGTQGVCPEGWHLPSREEFETLINYIDPTFGYGHTDGASSSTAGEYLKATPDWIGGNGWDTYGFSALPGGGMEPTLGGSNDAGSRATFWSSTEYSSNYAYGLDLYNSVDAAYLSWCNQKRNAKSVRCLKDSNASGESSFISSSSHVIKSSGSYYNSSSQILTDSRDGRTYKTVTIGSQTWMAENLRYKTSDGACYNEMSSNCNSYGVLYPNATAMSVCPTDWHLPSSSEWQILFSAAGSASNLLADGTNSTEFSAILAGSSNGNLGTYAIFWTSQTGGYSARIDTYSKGVYLAASGEKINVRCVHD